jgi:excisionase family DNA binding protein
VPVQDRLGIMLTTREAAAHMNVCPTTVRRWLYRGTIRGTKFSDVRGRGRYRIPLAEIERLKNEKH